MRVWRVLIVHGVRNGGQVFGRGWPMKGSNEQDLEVQEERFVRGTCGGRCGDLGGWRARWVGEMTAKGRRCGGVRLELEAFQRQALTRIQSISDGTDTARTDSKLTLSVGAERLDVVGRERLNSVFGVDSNRRVAAHRIEERQCCGGSRPRQNEADRHHQRSDCVREARLSVGRHQDVTLQHHDRSSISPSL